MKSLIILDSKFLEVIKFVPSTETNSIIQIDLKKGNYFFIVYDKTNNKHTIKNFTVYEDNTFSITVT